jgi:uncharacterized protein (TIGR03435 family)
MKRAIVGTILMSWAGWPAFGQSSEAPPKFEFADVHASAKGSSQQNRSGLDKGERLQVKNASMADLVGLAYGFATDKVLGGPNWLEMDRFDVIAKLPADADSDTLKRMLQALLEDRFKLVVHKDTKPVPTLALSVGKKPLLKEASGSEEKGCKVQANSGAAAGDGVTIAIMGSSGGSPTKFTLGPGMTVQYACRNMTMAAFADALHTMFGTSVGPNPILDDTDLKGNWNFDLRYSISMFGPIGSAGDRISLYDALDKQLGLKLEEKPVPTPVIVVDSVNRKPSENPPGVAEALPAIPAATGFEVASMKPSDPGSPYFRYQTLPGGRLNAQGMTLRSLINRAFNTNNNDAVAGLPKFAETDRYDIVAKAPSGADTDSMAPMLLALLADRCKMTYHTEDRPVSAYSLVAAKPKMKKADPDSRTWCKFATTPPPGTPAGSRVLTCQNATMAQFAERLQGETPELNWPVVDATGIEGGWDFTLTFTRRGLFSMNSGGGNSGQAADAVPSAAEPAGGITLFEAVEKQLGLKLEKQKRTAPVIVIDHFEKPAEN